MKLLKSIKTFMKNIFEFLQCLFCVCLSSIAINAFCIENWILDSSFISNVNQRHNFIMNKGDSVFSFGVHGARCVLFNKCSSPKIVAENTSLSDNSKIARSCVETENCFICVTRQNSGGQKEIYIPKYRFRFEEKNVNYSTQFGDFDEFFHNDNVIVSNDGEPDPNYGVHSLRISSLNDGVCSGLLKKNLEAPETTMQSSFWLKIDSTINSSFSIPLLSKEDSTFFSLFFYPIDEFHFSVSLSNEINKYYIFKVGEWYNFKTSLSCNESKLWWREKECGDWNILQEKQEKNTTINAICIGIRNCYSRQTIMIDDYYCNTSDIDEMSYVMGSIEILDKNDLHTITKYRSDIKYNTIGTIDELIVVSGLRGFNVYEKQKNDSLNLLFSHRDESYVEYQGLALFRANNHTYVVFSNYSAGISIWDLSNPTKTMKVSSISHRNKYINGIRMSGSYTFDVIADYPYLYSTIALSDQKKFGTEYDFRGVMVYDISDLKNPIFEYCPIPNEYLYTNPTADYQPITIRKNDNFLYLNDSERGIAVFDIKKPDLPIFKNVIAAPDDLEPIGPFCVDKDRMFIGKYFNGSINEYVRKTNSIDSISNRNEFYTIDTTYVRNSHVYIPIYLKNEDSITALSLNIQLPDEISFDNSKSIVLDSIRLNSHVISSNVTNDGIIRIAIWNINKRYIQGNNGVLFKLPVFIRPNATDDLDIKFNDGELVRGDNSTIHLSDYISKINILDIVLGDINNDANVDVADVVGIVNFIIERDTIGLNRMAADINQDGNVSITDVVLCIDKYIFLNSYNEDFDSLTRSIDNQDSIQYDLYLKIPQENIKCTALQFDIKKTNNISVNTITTTSNNHIACYSNVTDDVIRVLCYSPSNSVFPTADNILSISVSSNKSITDDILNIENMMVVYSNLSKEHIYDFSFVQDDRNRSEINKNNRKMYDINGRKITKVGVHGVYLINNNKIVK